MQSKLLLVVLTACAAPLAAQRAHQIELGGYASSTRYDRLMRLQWRVGAGLRLGYFLTDALGLEVEGSLAQPRTQTPLAFTSVRWLSTSVVLNVQAGSNYPYLLAGYTRIQYGGSNDAPYDFGDHAVHGAVWAIASGCSRARYCGWKGGASSLRGPTHGSVVDG
jgi:hypothetical protein